MPPLLTHARALFESSLAGGNGKSQRTGDPLIMKSI